MTAKSCHSENDKAGGCIFHVHFWIYMPCGSGTLLFPESAVTDVTIWTQKLFFGAILDGNGANCIGIKDVEDNNICVATVGHDGEAAGLIGEEVAIDFIDGHENKLCVCDVGFLRDILHGVIDDVRHQNWLSCWIGKTVLGGLDTLAILIHESHFRLCGDRDVTACPL